MLLTRRGIVLVTVMFFILIVGLIGRVILVNGPAMARLAGQAGEELQAQRAAEAGAAYARLRIRENGDWIGDSNTLAVNEADFKVQEQDGNVIGWLRANTGEVSMFRIRFNFRDGAGGGDSLPDVAPPYNIDSPYLSLNNIRNNGDTKIPDVNPSTFQVDDPAVGTIDAPGGSAFLRIEGWAGSALSNTAGPGDPPSNGRLAKSVLRVIYKPTLQQGVPDSALSAGNGIEMEVEQGVNVAVNGSGEARLRSKLGIDAKVVGGADAMLDMQGEVAYDPSHGFNALLSGDSSVSETTEQVGDGRDFHNLDWADVPKASADPGEAVQMKAGIYIATSDGKYHYYDMDLATFESQAIVDPALGLRAGGTELSSNFSQVRPDGVALGGVNVGSDPPYVLTFSEDVNFIPSDSGLTDVLFSTVGGREIHRNDNTYKFSGVPDLFNAPGTMIVENATLTSSGNLGIMVDVVGQNASLTAEREAIIAAPSVALLQDSAVAFDQRLSVYAQGDLTVSTYRNTPGIPPYVPAFEGYSDLTLEGLLYTWGDAKIYTGTPGEPSTTVTDIYTGVTGPNYAKTNIVGALVAYGADPSLFDQFDSSTGPGTNGNGKISIHGLEANITYDITKLVADPSSLPVSALDSLERVSYGFED